MKRLPNPGERIRVQCENNPRLWRWAVTATSSAPGDEGMVCASPEAANGALLAACWFRDEEWCWPGDEDAAHASAAVDRDVARNLDEARAELLKALAALELPSGRSIRAARDRARAAVQRLDAAAIDLPEAFDHSMSVNKGRG